ncbi:MAG: DNA translocase FtsK 4TM domain-containing protein, partial [Flavitalea sp.]
MANRLKSKGKSPDSNALKPEKEEKVSMKELVRDERTHKIAGTGLLLIGIFLFTCFTSYLFTWSADQSEINRMHLFFPDKDVKVENVLGTMGAWASYQFINNGFGVASFLFCILFFTLGINEVTGKKIFSFKRHLRYVLAGVLYFSVALAFMGKGFTFNWGGEMGKLMSGWLSNVLGAFGTTAVLIVGGLAYIIWRFNPAFNVPSTVRFGNKLNEEPDGEIIPDITEQLPVKEIRKNRLKKENGALIVPVLEEEPELNTITLVDKEISSVKPLLPFFDEMAPEQMFSKKK